MENRFKRLFYKVHAPFGKPNNFDSFKIDKSQFPFNFSQNFIVE